MSGKPMTVAVATYADKAGAEQDYDALHGIKRQGQIDHLAVAVVAKDDKGKLHVDRHNSSAKHAAWGTGVLGSVLAVVSAPLGIVFLGPLAATGAVWAGAGGLVGHFWDNIPKDEVRRMNDILEAGQHGLVVVAVNAQDKIVTDGITDPDGALELAFEKAETE